MLVIPISVSDFSGAADCLKRPDWNAMDAPAFGEDVPADQSFGYRQPEGKTGQ
jgi:hypothetical protein